MAISDSYDDLVQVSVTDAKNKLPDLIKAVEAGQPVTICRRWRAGGAYRARGEPS